LTYFLLERLQGFGTHQTSVRPTPREREAQKRPAPRAVHRAFGRIDRQLQSSLQEPRPTGQDTLTGPEAFHVDIAIIRVAHEPVASAFQLFVEAVQ
jgi:hypothetical protein